MTEISLINLIQTGSLEIMFKRNPLKEKVCKEKGLVNLVKVVGGSQFDRHESHGGRSDRYEVARKQV